MQNNIDHKEINYTTVGRALSLLLLGLCVACADTDVSPASSAASATPGLENYPTASVQVQSVLVETSPTPLSTDTPEPGTAPSSGPELFPWLNGPNPPLTEMANEIVATLEAGNQLEIARKELPAWYLDNIASIVFRGDGNAEGFTGLRLDPSSFVVNRAVNPEYEYYLIVAHAEAAQAGKRDLTIKDLNGNTIHTSKDFWRFVSDASGMAILAVKTQNAKTGVPKSDFMDLSEWDPVAAAGNGSPLKGLAYPYPDDAYPFQPWFVNQKLRNDPLFKENSMDLLRLDGPTAAASSGAPLIINGRVVSIMEAAYGSGAVVSEIHLDKITELLDAITQ